MAIRDNGSRGTGIATRITHTDRIRDLLDQHPELQDDRATVAETVGCHSTTAKRGIEAWQREQHWVSKGDNVRWRPCSECEHLAECRLLDAMLLPVLCESITETDLLLADLDGTLEVLEAGRV